MLDGFSGTDHQAHRAAAVAALEAAGPLAFVPRRALAATIPSDIQFDISAFLSSPPQTFGSGVKFQLPPVHTIFLTAALERTPAKADQAEMKRVLAALETAYPWGAANLRSEERRVGKECR